MVLGIALRMMKKLSYIAGSLLLLSCTAFVASSGSQASKSGNERIVTDSCRYLGATLRLVQEGGSAWLEAEDPNRKLTGKLKITPPCYFLRRDGELLSYAYKDIKAQGVLIVVGKIANAETKKIFGASEEDVCGEDAQGIVFKKTEIIIPEEIFEGGLICKDFGIDEKNFWDLSHPDK